MKTVYHNAKVYTGTLPLVEAFAVEDGRFVFAGSEKEALALLSEGDTAVDLGGSFVCAGFNDSHMHLLGYGLSLLIPRLDQHTDSLWDMICYLRDWVKTEGPRGGWIVGRGWNQDYFTDIHRMPNRWDLDLVSTDYPVCVTRACGHALAVNSRAIELLGLTVDTPCPEGGEIGMDEGELNGLFFDNAMGLINAATPNPDEEMLRDAIRAACRSLNEYGVTSCQTDDYGKDWRGVNRLYRELEQSGELTVRVYEQSNFDNAKDLQEFLDEGNNTGVGSDLFKIGPLKMLGDGALGPRTAFLSRPYADDKTTVGLPVFTQEVFDEMISLANRNGMQVAVHAIGDACLDRVLSAVEKALSECPREDHRHGIVHCQITRADQLEKIAQLKMHVYAQSIFLDYDSRIVAKRVGEELAETSYRWKTLLDSGVTVSNGTDCPVELPFALGGIQCAVTRKSFSADEPPYLPDEAFSVQQALDSYTKAGAVSSFEEAVKGQIAPGFLADFTVLGADPFSVDPNTIKDIPVLATYLGGKKVFGKFSA